MSDKYSGFTVALEDDIKDENATAVMQAILQIRGVIRVEPIVADSATFIAEARVRNEIGGQIINIVWPSRQKVTS